MRLRNKITNKICDAEAREDGIYIKTDWGDGGKWHKYGLGCLGDNWEYYVEPKEPLIKDEKIRKAVRAWAEANELDEVYLSSNGYEIYGGINDTVMQFTSEPFPFADEKETFTIDELCGEEEEWTIGKC